MSLTAPHRAALTRCFPPEFPCVLTEDANSIKGVAYVFSSYVCFEGRQCGEAPRLLVQPIPDITFMSKENITKKIAPVTILSSGQQLRYFTNISPNRDCFFKRVALQAEFWDLPWCHFPACTCSREIAELHMKLGYRFEARQFAEDTLASSLGLSRTGRLLDCMQLRPEHFVEVSI